MKRTIFFLAILAAFAGCRDRNVPAVVDFDIERTSDPLMVHFINQSAGASGYRWDFGDGSWSYATNEAYYRYDKLGTYTVTLTADIGGYKYDRRKQLVLQEPTIYIAGYTLYHIPYENQYYKIVFKDDNLLPSSWDFKTVYTPLLDNTDMPYTRIWSVPKQMVDIDTHTYYTIEVIRTTNTGSTSGDKSCMKQQLKVKDILEYQPEYVLQTETGATAVGILMQYTY